jgi:hypothetical protein
VITLLIKVLTLPITFSQTSLTGWVIVLNVLIMVLVILTIPVETDDTIFLIPSQAIFQLPVNTPFKKVMMPSNTPLAVVMLVLIIDTKPFNTGVITLSNQALNTVPKAVRIG